MQHGFRWPAPDTCCPKNGPSGWPKNSSRSTRRFPAVSSRWVRSVTRSAMSPGPGEQAVGGDGVDGDAALFGARATVDLPVELAGRVRAEECGVDVNTIVNTMAADGLLT